MYFVRQFFDALFMPIRLLFTDPQKLIATPRRLLNVSVPARVTIVMAIFLSVCIILACVLVSFRKGDVPSFFFRERLPYAVGLALVTLVVTYHAIRLWLEGDVSAFEDIDRAWRAGIAELERNGLDLREIPLFLVLGSQDERHEHALFDASQLSLTVKRVPAGPAALHWYANPDGVYVVASGVGCLSALASFGQGLVLEQSAALPVMPSARATGNIRGTVDIAGVGNEEPAMRVSAAVMDSPAARAPVDYRGTMQLGGISDPAESPMGARSAPAGRPKVELSRDIRELQTARLGYLCQLIRQARQPLCPLNGVLTLLPYLVIQWGEEEAKGVKHAVRSDLLTLLRGLRLRCPVTATIVGLESESGFRELVRRVGVARARAQRFGKGFGLWDPATSEQMEALCKHACGAFEDFVYTLFREKDSLAKPGNTKLFALLCKIRRAFLLRLEDILADGYGTKSDNNSSADTMLVGGCYFAATGEREDQQAFVKGVFDKLVEQQEDLEWTPEALAAERRHRRLAWAGFTLDAVLALGLVAVVIYFWKFRPPGET